VKTLSLAFEGYYQYRAPTDPDPTDEPRGVSGYTFAVAGEPDLDGLMHFQPDEEGVWERQFGPPGTPGPRVGVRVTRAQRYDSDTLTLEDDPSLVGARLALPGSRPAELNGIVVRNDYFAIDPVRVQLRGPDGDDTMLLDRADLLDPDQPDLLITSADTPQLKRRQPAGFISDSVEAAKALGLPDATPSACIADRQMRQRNLEALLAETTDEVQRAALEWRISQLNILRRWWYLSDDDGQSIDRRAHQLTLQAYGWCIDVNGPAYANTLGGDPAQRWPIAFWMGGFDGDALTAYVSGYLSVPLTG
jgi:hypothetical protein